MARKVNRKQERNPDWRRSGLDEVDSQSKAPHLLRLKRDGIKSDESERNEEKIAMKVHRGDPGLL